MTSRSAAWAFVVSVAFCAIPASAVDLYANPRYVNSLQQVPNGRGGLIDASEIRTEGDISASGVEEKGFGLRTLRAEYALVGSYVAVPYGDWNDSISTRIAEATLDFDPLPSLLLVAGKKREKMGSGFFRRPTDIFLPNPDDLRNQSGDVADRTRDGLTGAGMQWTHSLGTISGFYSPRMEWRDSGAVGRYLLVPQRLDQWLVKSTSKIGEFDLDLLARIARGSRLPLQENLGASLVTSVGNTQIHAEALLSARATRLLAPQAPEGSVVTDVLSPSVTAIGGFSHSFDEHWTLIGEYYRNGSGLSHSDLSRATKYVSDSWRAGKVKQAQAFSDSYGSLDMGTHYGMGRVAYADGETLLCEVLSIVSLEDHSGYAQAAATYGPSGWLKLHGEFGAFFGPTESEGAVNVERWRSMVGLEIFY